MKKSHLGELRKKTIIQLEKEVAKERGEKLKFTTEFKAGKKKSPKKGRELRKSIAQALTVIREKELVEKESKKAVKEGGKGK